MPLETLNYIVALGTLALQFATVALLVAYLLRKQYPMFADVIRPIGAWGIQIAFLAAFAASTFALVHSMVYGLPPCPLCWWQRALMFPQVILFAVALIRRESTIAIYSIALSAVGLCIAIYHHALQMFPSGSLPCPTEGTVSCAQILFLEFGYITYPLMAGTLFAFIIVVMLLVRARD